MAADWIMDTLRRVIAAQFNYPAASITRDTVATDVPGWDSLSHTVLILKVEDAFGIELPEEEIFNLKDVAELAGLVERLLA
jgi:acyl carrier protein